MHTQPEAPPFDPVVAEERLDALVATICRRLRSGERPTQELSQLETAAHELLAQITDDAVRDRQAAERARQEANRTVNIPSINPLVGQRGLGRFR